MSRGFDRGRAFRLFEQALGLPDAARTGFLTEACAGDAALYAELEALLAAAGSTGVDTGFVLRDVEPAPEDLVGAQIGRFRLVALVGEGGMGVVYRADRTDGIAQTVAVKLIGNALGARGQERFKRETQLLARLEHPSIARLIDAGVEDGRAWIAIEFVAGQPIDAYCAAAALPLRARVALLADLAGAVAVAHRMLVVHRDIKPANVLVTADGAPKLIDFGIAAALADPTASHAPTADIGQLFTPHYAAPEQVTGAPITVATDVFGLGALGYRLLTGQVIHADAGGALGYLLAVTQREVTLPSRAVYGADRALAGQLRGDLDAILEKALARDPAARYASAADLQQDLHRYLGDRPIHARAPSLAGRAGKFVRRNALAVGLAGVLACALVGGLVAYLLQAARTAEAREMSARRGDFLQELLRSANPRGGRREVTVASLLDKASGRIGQLVDREPLVGASMLGLVADTNLGLGRYAEGLAASARQIEILRARGGGAVDLAGALSVSGALLIKQGRDKDAQVPLEEALALVEHRRDAAHLLATILDGLAQSTQNLGDEAGAERLYRREIAVIDSSGAIFGGEAAFPWSGLATLRHDQGRYAESVAFLERGLAIARARFPADHPDLLDTEYNYAVTLEQAHKAAQAEPVFRSLLASYRRILGPEHSDSYAAQQGLAHDLLSQGRFREAATEALPAAEGLERTLGDTDAWTLTAWGVYGISACLAGDGDRGLVALRRVAALRSRESSPESASVMSTNVQIGTCLVALRRFDAAEPLLLHAVAVLETSRGTAFDRTQAGYRALRDLYAQTERYADSAEWARKVLPAGP